jgi:hypothetical protein
MRGECLGFIITRRPHQVSRADYRPVEPRYEKFTFGHQQHSAIITFQSTTPRGMNPSKASTIDDRGVCRLAQCVQVVIGKLAQAFDEQLMFGPWLRGYNSGHCLGRPVEEISHYAKSNSWLFST